MYGRSCRARSAQPRRAFRPIERRHIVAGRKGKPMLALSRDLGLSYKTAFVLCLKMREAMASGMRGRQMGGAGKTVEVDGACFGGYRTYNITTMRMISGDE